MSHFIALSQRIKAIETIKKTTSAMRLISMSTHSRLRNQKSSLEAYTQAIEKLLQEAMTLEGHEKSLQAPHEHKKFIILISSQKGLCGNFNNILFHYFNDHQVVVGTPLITVGKYAADYIASIGLTATAHFNQCTIANFTTVAGQISAFLVQHKATKVKVFSNYSKTFFLQKPEQHVLKFPGAQKEAAALVPYLTMLRTKSTLTRLLYESLLAEQAARFLSMDTASRNAEDVLTTTKLAYNKARQAHVTRELMELSGGTLSRDDS